MQTTFFLFLSQEPLHFHSQISLLPWKKKGRGGQTWWHTSRRHLIWLGGLPSFFYTLHALSNWTKDGLYNLEIFNFLTQVLGPCNIFCNAPNSGFAPLLLYNPIWTPRWCHFCICVKCAFMILGTFVKIYHPETFNAFLIFFKKKLVWKIYLVSLITWSRWKVGCLCQMSRWGNLPSHSHHI